MATAAPSGPATDDGGGDCYLCGGKGTVEDIDFDDGREKPCPACRPAGWNDADGEQD